MSNFVSDQIIELDTLSTVIGGAGGGEHGGPATGRPYDPRNDNPPMVSTLTTSRSGTSLTCPPGTAPSHVTASGNVNGKVDVKGFPVGFSGNVTFSQDHCEKL
jgi:hypothetical protein